ncbi:MAG: hypothetical protein A2X86_17790 [Bdellovibrionales bacterium GWA2_49_15]|nr:MAG: hypothetical protein A2X86_17790 [Bdellovibrionales bacterium GWA2_49_15]HAZ14977.1 hypothetical protein [Bdellovibrionales bacterium]
MNINTLFEKIESFLSPNPWALFEITGEACDILHCIKQKQSSYVQDQKLSLFDVDAIIRTLLKKAEVCTPDIVDQTLPPKTAQIAIILTWEIARKWVLVFGPFHDAVDETKVLEGIDEVRSSLAKTEKLRTLEIGRLFPRYNVGHLPTPIEIENDSGRIKVLEIGTGGIRVESTNDLSSMIGKKITLKVKEQAFYMIAHHIWSEQQEKKFDTGFSVRFESKENFEKWFVFTKALHRLAVKKRLAHATP